MSRAHDLNSSALPTGTENGQGSVSASQLQSQPWMKWSQLEALSGLELFGTTLVGIKRGGMVLLAAEGLSTALEDKTKSEKNTVKLEWVTNSVFVARSGYLKHSHRVIKTVRQKCKDVPPKLFGDVVKLFVEEANKELETIKKDVKTTRYSFIVGGRLHCEHDCHLFVVQRVERVASEDDVEELGVERVASEDDVEELGGDHHHYIYESESGELFCHSGKEFFQRQNVLSRLEEAANDYDRAEIAEIVKEFLKESCVNHDHSKGRATMVTIDERGFHIFESAHPIEYENPARGYKASDVGEFYPHGYHTP